MSGGGREDARLPGDAGGLNAAGCVELGAQGADVVLDRLRADMECLGDGAVGKSVADQGEDFELARAEAGEAFLARTGWVRRGGAAVDDRVGEFGGEGAAALHDGGEGPGEVLGRGAVQQDARGAMCEKSAGVGVSDAFPDDQDRRGMGETGEGLQQQKRGPAGGVTTDEEVRAGGADEGGRLAALPSNTTLVHAPCGASRVSA